MLASAEAPGPGPPPISDDPGSACHAEPDEVYQTVNGLTAEQLEIALFWSDDPGATATPPGHSISIRPRSCARGQHAGDAAVATHAWVWRSRMPSSPAGAPSTSYNVLRPITYIRRLIDPAWGSPLPLVTPPFPEYTSGHSVQSGAAARS